MSAHIDPLLLESAAGSERRSMLAHLRGCAACRDAVAAHDPVMLFGLLAMAPVPETVLDELQAGVARLAGSDRSAYGALASGAAWPRVAAVAAVIVLTLFGATTMLKEPQQAPPPMAVSRQRADVDVDSARGVSQVIDLTVGETQIVMVYNGDLKL
jgi:hypothetical protein